MKNYYFFYEEQYRKRKTETLFTEQNLQLN